MPLITHVQFIIDAAFFLVIMIILQQMKKQIVRMPKADTATIDQLKKLISESQISSDFFLRAIRESEERFGNLARQLDNRERRMLILIESAESMIQKMSLGKALPEVEGHSDDKYMKIRRHLRDGLSRDDVAARLDIPVGEVDLFLELEQARTTHPWR